MRLSCSIHPAVSVRSGPAQSKSSSAQSPRPAKPRSSPVQAYQYRVSPSAKGCCCTVLYERLQVSQSSQARVSVPGSTLISLTSTFILARGPHHVAPRIVCRPMARRSFASFLFFWLEMSESAVSLFFFSNRE